MLGSKVPADMPTQDDVPAEIMAHCHHETSVTVRSLEKIVERDLPDQTAVPMERILDEHQSFLETLGEPSVTVEPLPTTVADDWQAVSDLLEHRNKTAARRRCLHIHRKLVALLERAANALKTPQAQLLQRRKAQVKAQCHRFLNVHRVN